MKRILFISWLIVLPVVLRAQTGFNCQSPIVITQVSAYCSANGQYNNNNNAQNGFTWFQFTATSNLLSVTISGSGTGGSLVSPTGSIYADCAGTLVTSIKSTTANVTSLHAEGLTPGHTYYVAVAGHNKGTFKLCLNNYNLLSANSKSLKTVHYGDNTKFDVRAQNRTNIVSIPSAFTPNNDGYNDTFRASITNTKSYRIQIFNRHGSVVFESRDPMVLWDGNYNASQVPAGVYYYLINAVGVDGNAIKQSGSVTLIR